MNRHFGKLPQGPSFFPDVPGYGVRTSFTDNPTVLHRRFAQTIATVNAGVTLLAAIAGMKYRLVDVIAIAVGGAAAAVTTVDILGTQSASVVKLAAFAQASLTQNTVLRPGVAGTAVLAGGASFLACDANTAITAGITGASITTATHIHFHLAFCIDE
jgi:hypothetical protein